MRILKNSIVNTFLLCLIMTIFLLCFSSQVQAAQEGDYTYNDYAVKYNQTFEVIGSTAPVTVKGTISLPSGVTWPEGYTISFFYKAESMSKTELAGSIECPAGENTVNFEFNLPQIADGYKIKVQSGSNTDLTNTDILREYYLAPNTGVNPNGYAVQWDEAPLFGQNAGVTAVNVSLPPVFCISGKISLPAGITADKDFYPNVAAIDISTGSTLSMTDGYCHFKAGTQSLNYVLSVPAGSGDCAIAARMGNSTPINGVTYTDSYYNPAGSVSQLAEAASFSRMAGDRSSIDITLVPASGESITQVSVVPASGYVGDRFSIKAGVKNNPDIVFIQFDDPGNGWLDLDWCRQAFPMQKGEENADGSLNYTFSKIFSTAGSTDNGYKRFYRVIAEKDGQSAQKEGFFVVSPNFKPAIELESPVNGQVYAKGNIPLKATAGKNAVAMNAYLIKADGSESALLPAQQPGNIIDTTFSIGNSGTYQVKINAVNSLGLYGTKKITIIVGDAVLEAGSVEPSSIVAGDSQSSCRVALYGKGFVGYQGTVDVVTFTRRGGSQQYSATIDQVEPTRILLTLPGDMVPGRYDVWVKKAETNQYSILENRFEVKSLTVTFNGNQVTLPSYPFRDPSSDQIMVPFELFKSFNPTVWDTGGAGRPLQITLESGRQISIDPSTGEMLVSVPGSTPSSKPCRVTLKDGVYYVPVRIVAEALGAQVQWDGYSNCVRISYTPAVAEPNDDVCLPAPSNVRVTEVNSSLVELRWDEVPGAAEYHVYRCNAEDVNQTEFDQKWSKQFVCQSQSLRDTGVVGGNSYYYGVCAFNQYGRPGGWGQVKTYVPQRTGGYLPAPANLEYSNWGYETLILDWEPVNGASCYRVYAYNNSKWRLAGEVSDSCYILDELDFGMYGAPEYYAVVAVNDLNEDDSWSYSIPGLRQPLKNVKSVDWSKIYTIKSVENLNKLLPLNGGTYQYTDEIPLRLVVMCQQEISKNLTVTRLAVLGSEAEFTRNSKADYVKYFNNIQVLDDNLIPNLISFTDNQLYNLIPGDELEIKAKYSCGGVLGIGSKTMEDTAKVYVAVPANITFPSDSPAWALELVLNNSLDDILANAIAAKEWSMKSGDQLIKLMPSSIIKSPLDLVKFTFNFAQGQYAIQKETNITYNKWKKTIEYEPLIYSDGSWNSLGINLYGCLHELKALDSLGI